MKRVTDSLKELNQSLTKLIDKRNHYTEILNSLDRCLTNMSVKWYDDMYGHPTSVIHGEVTIRLGDISEKHEFDEIKTLLKNMFKIKLAKVDYDIMTLTVEISDFLKELNDDVKSKRMDSSGDDT